MSLGKGKTDKGSGGRRGHSSQDNWLFHQEEKWFGRLRRRLQSKELVSDELDEIRESEEGPTAN